MADSWRRADDTRVTGPADAGGQHSTDAQISRPRRTRRRLRIPRAPDEPRAWEAKWSGPAWAKDSALWQDAFDVLREDPPEHDWTFPHRDFGPRNVLWSEGRISGIVDWVETSLGPAWLDVAHCCTNIALVHGNQAADLFAAAYTRRTGRGAQAYFDVMDIVGFLPPPEGNGPFHPTRERENLEERLRVVMSRTNWATRTAKIADERRGMA